MTSENPATLVKDFWMAMNGNDWRAVAGRFLAHDFVGLWPQSSEVIDGPEDFIRVNGAFPGQGGWRFEIISLTSEDIRVVSDTRVSHAGLGITARAITFHQISEGKIRQQNEFWPDTYPVPEWRQGLLRIDPDAAFC